MFSIILAILFPFIILRILCIVFLESEYGLEPLELEKYIFTGRIKELKKIIKLSQLKMGDKILVKKDNTIKLLTVEHNYKYGKKLTVLEADPEYLYEKLQPEMFKGTIDLAKIKEIDELSNFYILDYAEIIATEKDLLIKSLYKE